MQAESMLYASIAELGSAMQSGKLSSRALTDTCLARVESLEARFNAVIVINPDARDIADAMDRERACGHTRGALHGIPFMVKDNLDTGDKMPTTAGSIALAGTFASNDSAVVEKLRAAGAVLLGKTNLSEWANFRSTRSSSGWSSVGGQSRNAHDALRTPGGSSAGSGVAVALGYCPFTIGTETDGSVVGPSSFNGIVGIKPSIGLVSRRGIIPIAESQDTAGPMTRSVADAALVLAAIVGADNADPVTEAAGLHWPNEAVELDANALKGARIGVARNYAGFHDRVDGLLETALSDLRNAGAEIIDPVDIPPMNDIRPHVSVVMETEFKAGLATYLATRQSNVAIRNVSDLIAFNRDNAAVAMPHFQQERLEASAARGDLNDPDYLESRRASLQYARAEGIDAALQTHHLDAIIAPTHTAAWLIDWIGGDNRRGGCSGPPAAAGYPHITVPMGFVEHLPVGLSFFAGAFQDRDVIRLAYAYEQYTHHFRAPEL